ncbi:hypothetical protein AAVH_25451 [Aphelenchoides avenae]|nr:hypothetical protein AAVH_25451 [Aphelenchus avenae]
MIPPPTPKADYDASTMGSSAAFDYSTASTVTNASPLSRAAPQPSAPPLSPDLPPFQPSGMFNGIRGLYQEKMTSDPQYKSINARLAKTAEGGEDGASKPNGPQKSTSPTSSSGQNDHVDANSRFASLKVVS